MRAAKGVVLIACGLVLTAGGVACSAILGIQDQTVSTTDAAAPFADTGACSAEASTTCSGLCVDTSSDPANCGGCGHACTMGQPCVSGRCGNEVVDVGSGLATSCVLLRSGKLYCWGQSTLGLLTTDPTNDPVSGDAGFRSHYAPVPIAGVDTAIQIADGEASLCALRKDGAALCWGANGGGQLGHNSASDPSCAIPGTDGGTPCNAVPTAVAVTQTHPLTTLRAGGFIYCGLTNDRDVYCWGSNTSGVIGSPPFVIAMAPARIGVFSSDVIDVGVGNGDNVRAHHACAVRADNTVWCWGSNSFGELGHPAMNDSTGGCANAEPCNSTPQQVVGIDGVMRVAIGARFSCALKGDGSVWCWGSNRDGIFGMTADGAGHPTPQQVTGLPQQIASIVAGEHWMLAIDATQALWAWGENGNGALGDDSIAGSTCPAARICRPTPQKVASLGSVAKVAAGYGHNVALKTDGTVWVWGSNQAGQLGRPQFTGSDRACPDGNIPCSPTPTQITALP